MNFMNRAWLYIVRKRGKSILLFVILLLPSRSCGKVLAGVFSLALTTRKTTPI